MANLEVNAKIKGIEEAVAGLKRTLAADAYRRFYSKWRQRTRDRIIFASLRTPYAPASVGTRQTVTGDIRGEGARFGIDSGAFLEAVTSPGAAKFVGETLTVETDLEYANRLNEFYTEKGPFAPLSAIDLFPEDVDLIEDIVIDLAEEALN